MKTFTLFFVSACLCNALPTSQKNKFKRAIYSASENGSNLIENATRTESPVFRVDSNNITQDFPKIEASIDSNFTQTLNKTINETNIDVASIKSRAFDVTESPNLHADEFKVKILDLNEAKKIKNTPPFSLDSAIKTPEVYVIKVPHYVIIKEPDFLRNDFHFAPTITGPFHPFQEIPSLTHDFSSGSNIFEIPDAYPIYPVENPGAAVQYPIIPGGSEIPVISEVDGISQGADLFNPPLIEAIQFSDEKINYEGDSIIVEAVEKLKSDFLESNKNSTNEAKDAKNTTVISQEMSVSM